MDLTPEERRQFERIGGWRDEYGMESSLTAREIAQVTQLLDERGVRQTCLLCDAVTCRWCFVRPNENPNTVLLTRTCERCGVITTFDALRLFPANPIRARAEAWAETMGWESDAWGVPREVGIKGLMHSAVWHFTSRAQQVRFNEWYADPEELVRYGRYAG